MLLREAETRARTSGLWHVICYVKFSVCAYESYTAAVTVRNALGISMIGGLRAVGQETYTATGVAFWMRGDNLTGRASWSVPRCQCMGEYQPANTSFREVKMPEGKSGIYLMWQMP
jgi:hypothetical protein